jgi:hypothetical protein
MRRFTVICSLLAVFVLLACAADVTGTWKGSMDTPNGSREVTFNFKTDGDKLTGTISGRQGDVPIQDGKITGEEVSFVVVRNFNGNEFKMQYKGKVSGNEMKLDVSVGERSFQMTLKKT